MENITIKIISKEKILAIIPLIKQLNKKTPIPLLKLRVLEMSEQNYECAVMYDKNILVGICGIWYMTRHYIGKSMEVDHVILDKSYRGKGFGKIFFDWIYKYAQSKGCEASELNAYFNNSKGHKFYLNEGYAIKGFHFLKVLREDGEFY